MKYKTITAKQYNQLLNRVDYLEDNNIKLIKSKIRLYVGMSVFAIAIITPFTNWFLIPLSLAICGLSLFEIKNIYYPEIKRKLKNKIKEVSY